MDISLSSPRDVQALITWMYLGKRINQERFVAAHISAKLELFDSFPQYVKLSSPLPAICQCGRIHSILKSDTPVILSHCEQCQGMEYLGWKDRIWYGNIPQWAVDFSEIISTLAVKKVITCQTQLEAYLKFQKTYGRI